MAIDFAANLPNPGSVTGSSPVRESTAATIGAAIGGFAKILDVGLKASAEDRQEKLLGSLEDQLNPQVQAYGASQATPPALIGENTDPTQAALNSSPSITNGSKAIDALRQGNAQGRVSQAEFMGKTSSIVQQMIHDHPRFADAIRERAQKMLGTNPTAEMVKIQSEDQDYQKQAQRQVQMDAVKAGVDGGVAYMTPDGQIDMGKTASAGLQIKAADHQIDIMSKDLENQVRQKELSKGTPVTFEEKQDIVEKGIRGVTDNLFETRMDAALKSLNVDKYLQLHPNVDSQSEADERGQILQGIGNMEASWNTQFNKYINKLSSDPEQIVSTQVADRIGSYYKKQFDTWREWAKGDLSSFAMNTRALEDLKARTGKNAQESMPVVSAITNAFGPQAIGPTVSNALTTDTKTAGIAQGEIYGYIGKANRPTDPHQTLMNAADVAMGQGDINDKATMSALSGALSSYSKRPNDLNPQELSAYGNTAAALLKKSEEFQNPVQLRGAVNAISSPGMQRVFDRFASDPNNSAAAEDLGGKLLTLNLRHVNRSIADLSAQSHAVPTALQRAGTQPGVNVPRYNYTPVYNPAQGKVEIEITGKDGQVTSDPRALTSLSNSMVQSVNAINMSLNAAVHFKQYGDDSAKNMTDPQLKQSFAFGLPIKRGQTAVDLENPNEKKSVGKVEDDPDLDELLSNQRTVESSNNQDAKSNQGAVGIAQIVPKSWPEFDADKLANDEEYNKAAQKTIMTRALSKYTKLGLPPEAAKAMALAEYHGGPNQKLWGPKTWAYVSKIMGMSNSAEASEQK